MDLPTDEDVVASARIAIDEARRQIDFQARVADSLDTRAAAIITFAGLAAGLVVGRLHLDSDLQRLSAVATAAVLAGLLVSAGQALRPRGGWSFGADLASLVAAVPEHRHRAVLLALATSLTEARARNARVLGVKQGWYERGLRGIVAALLAVGWMI